MPIPTAPDLIAIPFANTGDKVVPPATDSSGFVNFTQGYGPDYEIDLSSGDTSAKAVERKDQNYLFFLTTSVGQAWQQMSIAPWYSAMSGGYSKGAIVGRVNSNGEWQLWRSVVNDNIIDPNGQSQTSWEYVPYISELVKSIPMPAGGEENIVPGGQSTEIVTTSTDFNSFNTGIWEFSSDDIANGSANAPIGSGASTSYAGMLESKTWVVGSNTYIVQRYMDRTGVEYIRGATNGTFTPWVSSEESDGISFSVDTGSANAVQGNAILQTSALTDNQMFWVKVANANTGETTFSPSPSVDAKELLGSDYASLQGGELVVDGRILVIYRASTDNFILANNEGGSQRAKNATKSGHAVNLGQLNDGLGKYLPLAGGTMTGPIVGSNSTGGPSISAKWGTNGGDPAISSASDNSGSMSVVGAPNDQAAAFMSFYRTSRYGAYFGLDNDNVWKVGGWSMGSVSYRVLHEGIETANLTNLTLSGTLSVTGTSSLTNLTLSGTLSVTGTSNFSSSAFSVRPTFNGATPWDSKNLTPIKNNADNSTVGLEFSSGAAPDIADIDSSGNTRKVPLQIGNSGNSSASSVIGFIREGTYGAYFGLDTDNYWKVGGWSMGSVSYKIFHEGYTGFTSSNGTTGWKKDPDGSITQWGTVSGQTPSASYSVTFPIAFPNGCNSLILTNKIVTPIDVNADCYAYVVNTPGASSFTYYVMAPAGGTNTWNGMYWLATGY